MEKPETCNTCPLLHSAEGIVFGNGPRDAKLMLIGEAPGREEGAALRPFIGGAGRVLNALLRHAGINRKDVFLTNVVKCRPTARGANGQIANRQPSRQEIACCQPLLAQEIDAVRPNAIATLGNVPLHALTHTRKGVMQARSVPIEGLPRADAVKNGVTTWKVVPQLHPAYVMRQQQLWPAAVFDLLRASRESASPVITRRPWKRVIHARLADVGETLYRQIKDVGVYHHDLETTGLDPKNSVIKCIGVAASPDEVYCLDWTTDVQRFIYALHADASLTTVGQNSEAFDIPYQEAKGFVFDGPTYDTLIGWRLLNSDLPADLGFIGATVTDEPYWKDDTMYKSGDDALQTGCCIDVHATARAYEEQRNELTELGQIELYDKQLMPLQPVLRRMSQRGIRKDVKRAAAWHLALTRRADALEAKLRSALGDPKLNVASPKQLMTLLYDKMGLPVQYKNDKAKGRRPTADADALEALAMLSNNPILRVIRTIRTLRKWDATYVLCPMDERDFVHPKFGVAKTTTGRLSSWEPNGQNWPDEIRDIVVPDTSDHVFVSCDYSQIEWRIAMVLSGDEVGLDALTRGLDAHSSAYAEAYGIPVSDVTKKQRVIAKNINYGLMYGRGAASIAAGTKGKPESAVPFSHVEEYIARFFAKFKAYNEFRHYVEAFVRQHRYFPTAWGRRRWWYTLQLPEVYNYPMQGNAAHMLNEAMIGVEAELPDGASLRLSVHDELVVVTPKEQSTLRRTIECLNDVMRRPADKIVQASLYPDVVKRYYPQGWACETDWHIGETWRDAKPDTDEQVEAEHALKATLGISDMA